MPALAVLVATVGLGFALLADATDRAEATLDLTGNWNMSFTGDVTWSCLAPVTQTGTNLSMDLSGCSPPFGVATGTITKATGEFTVIWGGPPPTTGIGLIGTATSTLMSGSWQVYASGFFNGTFSGTIESPVGGIAKLADVESRPLEAGGASGAGPDTTLIVALTAAASITIGAIAWHMRRSRA